MATVMNKYATGYLNGKEDTNPENVQSSIDVSLNPESRNDEIEMQPEEDKSALEKQETNRLEKTEHTEFEISRTNNVTAIKTAISQDKRIFLVFYQIKSYRNCKRRPKC